MSLPADESKPNELEEAAFVSDTGDGTASLMKPPKPARHQRGRDTYFTADGDKFKNGVLVETDDDDEDSVQELRRGRWQIASESIFVFSSILYLTMACIVIDMYWFYRDTPRDVFLADDDTTWWDHFINGTDDKIPAEVWNATDDYTWQEWYNETAFFEDDYVWHPLGFVNDSAEALQDAVSKYQILYFFAALGFFVVAIIEICWARRAPISVQLIYFIMMWASLFGVASAILTHKNVFWSGVCNVVSTNIWALEACFIILQRVQAYVGSGPEPHSANEAKICNLSIKAWLWIADISFVIGTFGDAIQSWLYMFNFDNFPQSVGAIVFAVAWLITALIYFAVSIYDYVQYTNWYENTNDFELNKNEKAKPPGVLTVDNGDDGADEKESTPSQPSSTTEPPEDEIQRSNTEDVEDEGCCAMPTT